ncbi:SDR family oxidoreductase [Nocardia aurantia]|uniref:3-oxoacyl-[acyl-carrier-protein] reductase MabA n=1 Tax=Nocardia aurantia TaxID=2585199 RepID=A0A7K0DVI8_9NOCA|nr:SDR family oxidoreductase [Nocardia aurantia]MQY29352.1 2-dehydro-3-deoxy-D-gluconate 5-dehydrogenase [Nocardia aurantia]
MSGQGPEAAADSDPFRIDGQWAVVTGARTGIGRAAALALARAGANVVLWGRDRAGLTEVAAEVRALGRECDTVGADLTDPAGAESVATELAARRRIDLLVNNAGIISRGPAAEVSLTEWRRVLGVNLDAAFLLSRCFGTAMLARGSGRIVNIASLLSFQGGVNVASYTASKHGVAGLTKALATEWAGAGVGVNAIAPGYIATGNTAPLRADPERNRAISERIPAGRWGEPGDLAGAVVFLCSPAAAYVHGHVLVVDGGWTAR